MTVSIHDLVTPDRVAPQVGASVQVAAEILAAQRRAISAVQATNAVVVLPAITLFHRGDPLGMWCDRNCESMFDTENVERARSILVADESLSVGTQVAIEAGCPSSLLLGGNNEREVWTIHDVVPIVWGLCRAQTVDHEQRVSGVLDAFWSIAADEAQRIGWVWPYDRVALEHEIEDWLESNLQVFEHFGLRVVVAEPRPGVPGRQWRSSSGASRLDLLLEVVEDGRVMAGSVADNCELRFRCGDLVVVELKAVPLHGDDVAQIVRYVKVVESEIADGKTVWGILIGAGADQSFHDARELEATPIMNLWISQIGFVAAALGLD